MTPTPLPPDALDAALSGFFKAQMPHPWPAPPVPASAEPSTLVAARTRTAADPSRKARLTLAASVACLLGTCWFLSSGEQATRPQATAPGRPGHPGLLQNGSAKTPGEFNTEAEKAKAAKNPLTGFKPAPIDLP